MKASFFLRLKFAWYAFTMKEISHIFPYKYHCDLRDDIGIMPCDNIRRSSKCKNEGKVALANPSFEIKINTADHYYHVCKECEKKYTGTTHGEE